MNDQTKIIKKLVNGFQRILEEIPEVRYLGDPILRSKCEDVTLEEGIQIGQQLGEALKRYRKITGFGRGLAAPQIGLAKNVFVTFLDDEVQIYINPKIAKTSSEQNLYREMCLSSGLVTVDVKRFTIIDMQWTDNKGQLQDRQAKDVLARLWQHECAHLLGVPNVDQAESESIELPFSDPLQEKIRNI